MLMVQYLSAYIYIIVHYIILYYTFLLLIHLYEHVSAEASKQKPSHLSTDGMSKKVL